MMPWLAAIPALADDHTPAVMVTVASAEGSTPREAGAKMLVTSHRQFDTIGGGHLEMRACDIARDMLAMPSPLSPSSSSTVRLVRFALGPSLGQCCGGVVYLAFERLDRTAYDDYRCIVRQWHDRRDCWRLIALEGKPENVLVDDEGRLLTGKGKGSSPFPLPDFHRAQPCHLMRDAGGRQWLVDPVRAYRPHLFLFGAGHVGTALIRALADLPCYVIWVDTREDQYPDNLPANITSEITDTPEAVIHRAPAGASYLVMTHSHALDQQLCETILRRDDIGWLGLIGSTTKRRQFEHRLRERGIPQQRLDNMTCPVGLPGITGKTPAIIAASVSAQLLQVWEAQELAFNPSS